MSKDKANPETLPVAKNMEIAVIGTCINHQAAMVEANGLLTPETFFFEPNRIIWNVMQILTNEGVHPDGITLTERLRKRGELEKVGGPTAITKFQQNAGFATNIRHNCAILTDKYVGRTVYYVSNQIQEKVQQGEDFAQVKDKAILDLMNSDSVVERFQDQSLRAVADEQLDKIARYMEGEKKPMGLQTGLSDFDNHTNGLQPGLYFLGGRPSMGKTSLFLQWVNHISVTNQNPVAVFSMEMPNSQLLRWMEAQRSKIPSDYIRNGNLSRKQFTHLENVASEIVQAPILADDTPRQNIATIRSKCIKWKQQYGLQAVFIDYMQLMDIVSRNKNYNREREVAEISRNMKILQKELNVPVIVLTQLNRDSAKTGTPPSLENLRESGALEQDADFVMFIHRPERYGHETYEDGEPTQGTAQLIIAKNRDGGLKNIRIRVKESTLTYTDFDNDSVKNQYSEILESEESPF